MADTIKSLSDHGVKGTIILVGVADSVTELIQEHASVERALVQVRMPRMSNAEVTEILSRALGHLGMTMEDDAVKRVVLLSQGLPHYTHLIGMNACRCALKENRFSIIAQDVNKAIERALSGTQHSILSAYHKATMSPRKDNLFADVLLSCAMARADDLSYFAAPDVRDAIRVVTGKSYEIPSFSQHLNEFTEAKRGPILQRTGRPRSYRFRFINPLMQPFVIMKGFAEGKLTESAS